METETKTPVLPRTAKFAAVGKAVDEAYNALERLEFELAAIVGPYMDGGVVHELPDFAYLGELYSFIETADSNSHELLRVVGELRQDLGQLDTMLIEEAVS